MGQLAAMDWRTIEAALASAWWRTTRRRGPRPKSLAGHPGKPLAGRGSAGRQQAAGCCRAAANHRPCARAVRSPDRRLRMAALEAIVALQPQALSPAPAKCWSRWPTWRHPGHSPGTGRQSRHGRPLEEWVGAEVPQHRFRLGRHRPRCGCAFAPSAAPITRCLSSTWPPWLRRPKTSSPSCGRLPHGQFAVALRRSSRLSQTGQRIAEGNPLARAFSQPYDAEAARWQLARLMAVATRGSSSMSPSSRQPAVRALNCLAALAATSGKVYNLRRARNCAGWSLGAATSTGTPSPCWRTSARGQPTSPGQRGQPHGQPAGGPQAGGIAFAINVRRFGLLLDKEAIRQQYLRYSQSGSQSQAAQKGAGVNPARGKNRGPRMALEAARRPPRRRSLHSRR